MFWAAIASVAATGLVAPTANARATVEQAGWRPLLTIPNHPVYPAAHAVALTAGPSRLSVSNVTVAEDDAAATFVVRLAGRTSRTVSVSYATRDGTAKAGSDYTRTAGTLRFKRGQHVKRVGVPIIDDSVAEDDETFLLELSRPRNARLAQREGEATILANDFPAPFTATAQLSDASAPRAHGNATLAFDARASTVSFTVSVNDLPGEPSLVHIHRRSQDFLVNLSPVPPNNGTASGTATISRAAIFAIQANPSDYFVAVHYGSALAEIEGTLTLAAQ